MQGSFHETPSTRKEIYCRCGPNRAQTKRVLSHDFLSLFLEKNSDGTKNLRLKGNELNFRVKRRVEDNDAHNIADFILKYPEIVKIDMSYNPIGDNMLCILTERIFKHKNAIQYLNFTGCDIKIRGIKALLSAYDTLNLKILRLTGNKFGPRVGGDFDRFLTNNSTLEHLDMADTDQNISSIPYFEHALRQDYGYNLTLKSIDLSNILPISKYSQPCGTDIAHHLSDTLMMNTTLKELHIQKCGLDGHDLELLLIGLKINNTLELLDLGFNRIGNFGAELLSDWFKSEPNIIGVNIAGNSIGEFGGRAISFGLPFSKIRVFDISQNKINDIALSEILLSIKKQQHIRLFFLFGNEIGPLTTEVLERQMKAGVYNQSQIDFKIVRAGDQVQVAHYPMNNYKQKHYNLLEHEDVRELRIRRHKLPGPYCEKHMKLSFVYYDKLLEPHCLIDPLHDPTVRNDEELRKRCEEREKPPVQVIEFNEEMEPEEVKTECKHSVSEHQPVSIYKLLKLHGKVSRSLDDRASLRT